MIVIKIINNNVVLVKNDKCEEIILTGKGIGFQRKAGDEIDETHVDKRFLLENKGNSNHYLQLLQQIPYEYVQTADEIISYAKISLSKNLSDAIYTALTDHLNFAIERNKQGLEFKNALLWEIKRFYNHEFLIGKEALEIIKRNLGVELSIDEAGFIALHLVNAELNLNMNDSMDMTNLIQDIIQIVQYHYHIQIDDNSLTYERFVTHLKFFVQRAIRNQYFGTDNMEFLDMVKRQYKDEYQCAEKIQNYVETKLNYQVTEEEKIYLTVHIKRIIDSSVKRT